jgi:hypothetical protein
MWRQALTRSLQSIASSASFQQRSTAMPSTHTVENFVSLVEAGQFIEALERFYLEDASMRENTDPPRVGLPILIEAERRVMAASTSIAGRHVGPVFIDGDKVAIRWFFEFTGEAGETRTLDEITWQRWQGEKIAEEQFFYDPKQLGR